MKKLGCILLLAAGACGAHGSVYVFDVTMNGANEVGPNGSAGAGGPSSPGSVNFDDVTKVFSVSISYSGLSAPSTAAHVHGPAAVGVNAGVILPLSGTTGVTSGLFSGSMVYTSQQETDLFGGLNYLNIHSTLFPGGEIRGQIENPTLLVPEPGAYTIAAAMGLLGFAAYRRMQPLPA